MAKRQVKPEERPQRACDCCGRPATDYREVRVRAAGKATVYLSGVAKWCGECRRDNNGTWKYA